MNSVKITISVLFLSILLSACAQEKKDSTILPIVETGVLASIPEPSNIPPISNTELEQS